MIDSIILEMQILQKWTPRTTKQILQTVHEYEAFHKTSFENLLLEAEEDEEKIRKTEKRRIKQRLLSYILHLRERKLADSTILLYLSRIKQVYLYLDIEIPKLPRITVQQNESYEDISTADEIRYALENSNSKMKAVITFLASSGLRRSDTAKMTVKEFLVATRDYHQHDVIENYDIQKVVDILRKKHDVIPLFHITSEKTNTSHLAFCSSESVMFISQMLRERLIKQEVHLDDRLFELSEKAITLNFSRINDRLGFGMKKTRRKFHPHSMRKFFATTLTANDMDFLSTEFLLGHKLSSVQSSYYFANPEKLRLKYSRVMPKLCFLTRINEIDVVTHERRELARLREENKETRQRLYELEEVIDMLRHTKIEKY